MPDYPPLSTQVIGQAESALGALLDPLLAGTGITFSQWLVLTVTAASGAGIDRGQLVARISDARKRDGRDDAHRGDRRRAGDRGRPRRSHRRRPGHLPPGPPRT